MLRYRAGSAQGAQSDAAYIWSSKLKSSLRITVTDHVIEPPPTDARGQEVDDSTVELQAMPSRVAKSRQEHHRVRSLLASRRAHYASSLYGDERGKQRAVPVVALACKLPGLTALWRTDAPLSACDSYPLEHADRLTFRPLLGDDPYVDQETGRVRPLPGKSLLAALVEADKADLIGTETMEYVCQFKVSTAAWCMYMRCAR